MSNPNTSVKAILLQEVNTQYQLDLKLNDVTFSDPVLLNANVLDFSQPTVRNSRTVIVAGGTGGPKMTVTVDFNRLGLSKAFNLRSKEFADTQQTTTHGLLTAISERLGTQITADDIEDTAIVHTGTSTTVSLVAKATSFKVIGQVDITLKGEDTPQPVMANRMLFTNTQFSKLTDDLVVYSDISDQYAPVVVENRPARTAGLPNGFMVCLQTPEYGKIQINFRPGAGVPWQQEIIDGILESPNAVVFLGEAYFASSNYDNDPGGLCGLNRIKFHNDNGVWSVSFERVMDLWTANVDVPIQMCVDPVQNIFAVSSGYVHYTTDGIDWNRVELPMLSTKPGRAPLPRVVGLGLYNNKLRAVASNIRGGDGSSGENWEYIFCDEFIPSMPGQQRTFTIEPWGFGPHGTGWMDYGYSQGHAFYYGPEGWLFGLGVFSPRDLDGYNLDKNAVVGQIFKFQEDTRTWKEVSRQTGITNAAFVKLDNALVYAGSNNDVFGGKENVVVSYDDGDTWESDPSDPNSPFKLEPGAPATLTRVNLDPYTGEGPWGIGTLPQIVEQTWPTTNELRPTSRPVHQVTDDGTEYWIICAYGRLFRVDQDGVIDPNWGATISNGYSANVYLQNDGKIILYGGVTYFNGELSGYTAILRLNKDCTLDTTFVEPKDESSQPRSVLSMVHLKDGGWVLVGQFWLIGSAGNKPYIGRYTEDWTPVPNWGPKEFDSYYTRSVNSVVQFPDGKVLMTADNYEGRSTDSCWVFCDPDTGIAIPNPGLNLGTGLFNPEANGTPAVYELIKEPGSSDYWWIFTRYRGAFPEDSWGIRFDPVTYETINRISEGDCTGPGQISWLMLNGNWHLVNAAPYTGARFGESVEYEFNRVEFYTRDGEMLKLHDRPFGIYANNVVDETYLYMHPIDTNGRYLIYGTFDFINQAGYPRHNRVKSKNMAVVKIETGQV